MRTAKAFVPILLVGIAGLMALALLPWPQAAPIAERAWAQGADPLEALQFQQASAQPRNGIYLAGDDVRFIIDRRGGYVRLRFENGDEEFYLTNGPASLGSHVLRYDTGEVALKVAGWGEMTLYTRDEPRGLPAARVSDAPQPRISPPGAQALQSLAASLSRHLQEARGLSLRIEGDWQNFAANDLVAGLVQDAMRNTERALEWVAAKPEMRDTLTRKLATVHFAEDTRMVARLQDHTLVITYTTTDGPAGRPSSLALERALTRLF